MPTATLETRAAGPRFKTILWVSLGFTTLFVFITSELFLFTDYPMYDAYRLQVIAYHALLIPHTLAGVVTLLIGPLQFSSRFRQQYLKLHRVLGRIYVIFVFIGAATGVVLANGRPGFPGTSMQAAAWVVCTIAAFIIARTSHLIQHHQRARFPDSVRCVNHLGSVRPRPPLDNRKAPLVRGFRFSVP